MTVSFSPFDAAAIVLTLGAVLGYLNHPLLMNYVRFREVGVWAPMTTEFRREADIGWWAGDRRIRASGLMQSALDGNFEKTQIAPI